MANHRLTRRTRTLSIAIRQNRSSSDSVSDEVNNTNNKSTEEMGQPEFTPKKASSPSIKIVTNRKQKQSIVNSKSNNDRHRSLVQESPMEFVLNHSNVSDANSNRSVSMLKICHSNATAAIKSGFRGE